MNADYDYLVKLVVAGNSGVGKSSLICQHVDKSFHEFFVPTIGVDFRFKTHTLESGKVAKVQFWDTAGQERFRNIVASYWRGAHGVVFVFDLTDLSSFHAVERWAEDVARHARPEVQKILVGNKADLVSQRVVPRDAAERLASSLGIRYVETSAKSSHNVGEAFSLTVEAATSSFESLHNIKWRPAPEVLLGTEEVAVSRCCVIS